MASAAMIKGAGAGKQEIKHKSRPAKLTQAEAKADGAAVAAGDTPPADKRDDDDGALLLYLGGAVGAGGAAMAAGGAGDSQATILAPIGSANRAPVLTLQSGTVTQQDQPVMAPFTASDPDGDPLTYSVTQGVSGSAAIAAGAITYTPKPGYVGLDSVTATVSDGRGGTVSQTFTIQVRDNVAPKFTSPAKAEIAENSGAAQVVYSAAASDASPLTYALRAWDDAALFSIDAATGAVTLRDNPDFERKSSYAFTVVATDSAGSSSEQAVTLQVTDVFEDVSAPVFTSGATATAIREDTGAGQQVYRAAATDASAVTYSLKTTGDVGSFTINAATGAVTLLPNPDYAQKSQYAFTVVATDSAGNRAEQAVSLAVIDARAPVFTSSSTATAIAENSGAGQVIYTAAATDATTLTYSLKNAGDAAAFTINASTGAVTLIGNPDYETKSSYSFTVIATDTSRLSSEKSVSLSINDVQEGIYNIPFGVLAHPVIIANFVTGDPTYKIDFTGSSDISTLLPSSLEYDPHIVIGGMNIDFHGYPQDLSLSAIASAINYMNDYTGNSTAYIAFNVRDVDAATMGDQAGAAIVRYQASDVNSIIDANELNLVAVLPGVSVWDLRSWNFLDFA